MKESQEVKEMQGEEVTTVEGETDGEKKRRKPRQTFDKLITDFRAAIEISGEEGDFRDIIEYHGYTPERRQMGLQLINDTAAADRTKKDRKAELNEAARTARQLRRKAQKTLSRCVASARLAFDGDPNTLELLGLSGGRDQTFGGWAAFSSRFFEKSLETPARQEALAKYNVSLELLQQGQQETADAVEADKVKRSKKADAEVATANKNELYRRLRIWMSDYYHVVEIAFREKPQLKEKVGIVVPYLR